MSLGRIRRLTRGQVFDVIFWERDRQGRPVFASGHGPSATESLTEAAVRRGYSRPEAARWAELALRLTQRNGEDKHGAR